MIAWIVIPNKEFQVANVGEGMRARGLRSQSDSRQLVPDVRRKEIFKLLYNKV